MWMRSHYHLLGYQGKNVSADDYAVASTEWANGSKSDILYVSGDKATNVRPPILIEIQCQVNQNFMTSLIRSSTSVYNRYKVLPIVLIFAIKGFSDNTTKEEFTTNKRQYLLKISSKFWAKECSLSSIASINEHIIQSPTDESVVLGYFLISGSLSLMLLEHKSNPTVQLIYNITMQIFLREGNGKASKKIVTDQILEDTKRQLEKILEEDTTQEPDIKKIKHPLYSICVTAWQKQGMEKHIR